MRGNDNISKENRKCNSTRRVEISQYFVNSHDVGKRKRRYQSW